MKNSGRISIALLVLIAFFLLSLVLKGQTELNSVRHADRITLETKTRELTNKIDAEHAAAEADRQAQSRAIDTLLTQLKSLHIAPVVADPAPIERPAAQPRSTTTTSVRRTSTTSTTARSVPPATTTTTQPTTTSTTTTTVPCRVTLPGNSCVIH